MFPITEAWDGYEINDAVLEEYNQVMELSTKYIGNAMDKAYGSMERHHKAANSLIDARDHAKKIGDHDLASKFDTSIGKARRLELKRQGQAHKFEDNWRARKEKEQHEQERNELRSRYDNMDSRYK